MRRMQISGERIFEALGGRKSGSNKWRCFCPSHDDGRFPSLSITDTGERVLWNCFGGCSSEEVKQGLIDRGLFPEKGKSRPQEQYLTASEIEHMEIYCNIFRNDNKRGIGHPQNEIDQYKNYRSVLRKVHGSQ